jgi:hypothetical protein
MNDTDLNPTCGCCEGVEVLTPLATANRPGLNALAYRVGAHSSFLETMIARLSNLALELPAEREGEEAQTIYPLQALTTRQSSDPVIALLDGWATVADVLTFYQERIANEGYLRTATERRSILELARLVGYKLRPGVAASVYLAFTLDNGYQVTIPMGTRGQSIPGPGELPQSFETSEPLPASDLWNELKPRLTKPPHIVRANVLALEQIYLEGIATNLKPNGPLLLVFGDGIGNQFLRRVQAVELQPAAQRTVVNLHALSDEETQALFKNALTEVLDRHMPAAPRGETARQVKQIVNAQPAPGVALTAVFLQENTLPKLHDSLARMPDRYNRLKPWLQNLVADLETVAAGPWRSGVMEAPTTLPTRGVPTAIDVLNGDKNGTVPLARLATLLEPLARPVSRQPANAMRLARDTAVIFAASAGLTPQLLKTLRPQLADTLDSAWANAAITPTPALQSVEALRVKAALFGHNLPGLPLYVTDNNGTIIMTESTGVSLSNAWSELLVDAAPISTIALDAEYDQIRLDSWAVIWRPELASINRAIKVTGRALTIHKVIGVETVTKKAHGVSGKSTLLTLDPPWLDKLAPDYLRKFFNSPVALSQTRVYAQSEALPLAEEPLSNPICDQEIELDGLYDGLEAGRWLIISGERSDAGASGIIASERVMLAGVTQDIHMVEDGQAELPGDKTHTFLQLANNLAYCYKRDTVTIYGNVAKATHGETRQEVLGSGNGSQPFQRFTLKQPPVTFVSAPTPSGVESSLVVRVNDIKWHEAQHLVGLAPADRQFTTQTDDEEKMTVIFGDGRYGARLPTGIENVKAVYRNGIGKMGNVAAGQISLLVTRPLGVKGVVNPLPATGGADRDSRDQARRNAPIAVTTLDRLVSVSDYADFARTFAGIGKARAVRLADGRRQVVHLTIAGAGDIPIDKNSDLYRNLSQAVRQFGDPYQPVQIDIYRRKLLIISGKVRLLPDYLWEAVAPQIRARLLDTFSFERRRLGQDVVLSEVISVVQAVPGVAYIDIDLLDGLDESLAHNLQALLNTLDILTKPNFELKNEDDWQPKKRIVAKLAHIKPTATDPDEHIQPAELIYLSPDVPDTLILNPDGVVS